jgi:iron complex outermembrane recepter protein
MGKSGSIHGSAQHRLAESGREAPARRVRDAVRDRILKASVLLAAGIALPAFADATLSARHDVSIDAQPIAAALKALAAQTGLQLVVLTQDAANKSSPGAHGNLTTEEALTRILDDSGLTYEKLDGNTVAIRKAGSPTTASAPLHSTSYRDDADEGAYVALNDAPAGGPSSQAADAGPPAAAADQAGTQSLEEAPQQVVVTGSRLNRVGMTSPTPITSISPDELAAANPQSLSQGLAQLPSMATSTVPASIGGRTTAGPGTFLSLRGLGSTRNLILLDGMRIAPSNLYGNVDVNLLPQALVSSVQVVTGGASAAYGSDAVAGVTNFILNTQFTGFKADVNGGISGHGDGGSFKTSLAWGSGFLDDRLHVVASFDWRHSKPAYADNRPWSNSHCGVIPVPGVTLANETPSNPRQTFACDVAQANSAYGGVIVSGPWVTPTRSVSFAPGGVPQPFVYGQLAAPVGNSPSLTAVRLTGTSEVGGTGDPAYVGDVVNFYTPLDNKVLFGHVSYDLTHDVQMFAQLTASRTNSYYAQTPLYFNTSDPLTIYSGNPFIPASIQQTMTQQAIPQLSLGITPKSWGNIEADSSEESYDAVAGLKGTFGGSWSWDAHAEHGRYQFREAYENDVTLANLYRALDAVVDPATGAIVCRVMLTNPSPANNACAPLNPFGAGSASPEALSYIHGTAWEWNVITQTSAAADVNGEPFSTWAGPVSVGTGIEWRRLEGVQSSDPVSHSSIDFTGVRGVYSGFVNQTGAWATVNVLPYQGAIDVTEGYVEVLVPLLKDRFLARSLDLNAAGRGTGYSQSGTVETWKVGLTWRPIDDLLLRATESRDIRAPGISDLYQPVSLGPPVHGTDTVNGGAPFLVSVGTEGNPKLQPETARTFTGGFTYQPSWLPGFGVSVDYYDIKIGDVLAAVTAQDTVDRCALGEQTFCANIIRDSSGAISVILTPEENLNQSRTRGVDLEGSYRHDALGGKLSLRGIATRVIEQSTTTVSAKGSVYQDLAGSLLQGYPSWIFNGNVTWERGPLTLDLVARYVSSGPYNAAFTTSDLDSRFYNEPSNLTFDTGIHYRFAAAGSPELYLQVQNVFDKAPPILGGNTLIGFQTNSALYDTMGRYFTAGVRVMF